MSLNRGSTVLILLLLMNLIFRNLNAIVLRENFASRIKEYGLRNMEYNVTTEDGYILGVRRIFRKPGIRSNFPPVLIWHGASSYSDVFLASGDLSLVVALADAGYDIWLGNSRGNMYSRRHISLDPNTDTSFWNFSFHEMGVYDVPATIDFILKETGHKKLSAIGHSQGNTIFFILGSMKPEYNDKINILIALAPITYMETDSEPSPAAPFLPLIYNLIERAGVVELNFGRNAFGDSVLQFVCAKDARGKDVCLSSTEAYAERMDLNQEIVDKTIEFYSGGSSMKDLLHFSQLSTSKRFSDFDNGVVNNLMKYGSLQTPEYDLGKVSMPVALVCGANDRVSKLVDVEKLRRLLPNEVFYKVLERKEFNHLDFVLGKYLDEDVNPVVKELLNKYD